MVFHDEVLRAIRDGWVPWRFRTSDLKKIPGNSAGHYVVGSGEYSENAINTIPRNHSVRPDGTNPGDYVRNGRKPAVPGQSFTHLLFPLPASSMIRGSRQRSRRFLIRQ